MAQVSSRLRHITPSQSTTLFPVPAELKYVFNVLTVLQFTQRAWSKFQLSTTLLRNTNFPTFNPNLFSDTFFVVTTKERSYVENAEIV